LIEEETLKFRWKIPNCK